MRRYTFWIDKAHAAALKALVQTPGEETSESYHVRQAIREYLAKKGLTGKALARRGGTRRAS
jgi:Arc/MetJ-type ribon-helix-helix transcriptional regulator